MSAAACLVAGMRTAAPAREHSAEQWLLLAQQDDGLRETLRRVFGKSLPTAQKLGQWLQQHIGTKTGEFTLYGRHSPRAKAWRYAVMTAGELEARERQAEEKAAAKEAKLQAYLDEWRVKDRIRKERREQERRAAGYPSTGASLSIQIVPRPDALSELMPAPTSGPIAPRVPQPAKPTHGDDFLTRTVYDGDGVPRQEYVRDRNGNPVPAHTSVAVPQVPQPKPAEPARADPNAPPPETAGLTPPEGEWFNGCGRPRSPLERWKLGRAAGQGRIEPAGTHFQSSMPRPGGGADPYGFDDPGGVLGYADASNRKQWEWVCPSEGL